MSGQVYYMTILLDQTFTVLLDHSQHFFARFGIIIFH